MPGKGGRDGQPDHRLQADKKQQAEVANGDQILVAQQLPRLDRPAIDVSAIGTFKVFNRHLVDVMLLKYAVITADNNAVKDNVVVALAAQGGSVFFQVDMLDRDTFDGGNELRHKCFLQRRITEIRGLLHSGTERASISKAPILRNIAAKCA